MLLVARERKFRPQHARSFDEAQRRLAERGLQIPIVFLTGRASDDEERRPAPGAAPYTSRLWQFAIDESRTQIARYSVWRASTTEERAKATRVFRDLALPRLQKVSAEDAFAAQAQGDVVTARQEENLMAPDIDVVNVRRLIGKAFLSPITEHRRIDIPEGALLYPL